VNEGQPIRLALDQNFPTPLIRAVAAYLPDDVEVSSLHQTLLWLHPEET
jgi:hypothetical protein